MSSPETTRLSRLPRGARISSLCRPTRLGRWHVKNPNRPRGPGCHFFSSVLEWIRRCPCVSDHDLPSKGDIPVPSARCDCRARPLRKLGAGSRHGAERQSDLRGPHPSASERDLVEPVGRVGKIPGLVLQNDFRQSILRNVHKNWPVTSPPFRTQSQELLN